MVSDIEPPERQDKQNPKKGMTGMRERTIIPATIIICAIMYAPFKIRIPDTTPVFLNTNTGYYASKDCVKAKSTHELFMEEVKYIDESDRNIFLEKYVIETTYTEARHYGTADPLCDGVGGFYIGEDSLFGLTANGIWLLFHPDGKWKPRTFGGYICTLNCEGHAAGYRWAQRNRARIAECQSNRSTSFREGCSVFETHPTRGWQTDDAGREIGGS